MNVRIEHPTVVSFAAAELPPELAEDGRVCPYAKEAIAGGNNTTVYKGVCEYTASDGDRSTKGEAYFWSTNRNAAEEGAHINAIGEVEQWSPGIIQGAREPFSTLIEKYLRKETTQNQERVLLDTLLRFYNEMLVLKEEVEELKRAERV